MTKYNDYKYGPKSGNEPKQIIVLLHGYGSNGRDLISLAPYLADAAPDALFISPDAPFPCEIGMGFQWFSLAEYTPEKLFEGTTTAAPLLNDYLDSVLKTYNLEDRDLILLGFSQGTMMSLYTGPRRKNKVAGILGYSGALIGEEDIADYHKPPLHLIHGDADDVVPVGRYHDAVEKLKATGFDIGGHSTPNLGHSIDEAGIQSGSDFIKKIVS